MRGLHKSKRVTWAPDVNLCQVRLFLSEESPAQVGLDVQDHLQAKASWILHSSGSADDALPPGFEGAHPATLLQPKVSEIARIRWSCPPKFVLNFSWQVVAGEESEEVEVQNQREMRVLEAVYPRVSAIPANPSVSMDIENSECNDQHSPLIPITPIEDEDVTVDAASESFSPFNFSATSQPSHLASGISAPSYSSISDTINPHASAKQTAGSMLAVEPDIAAAASAAFAAIMKSNENGNMIDHELLMKILSNPKLLEKLVTDYGASADPQNVPKSESIQVASSDPPSIQISRVETSKPSSAASSCGPLYPQPNGFGMAPSPPPPTAAGPVSSLPIVGAPPPKDINYYKSLIQQHGGEKQDAVSQFGNRPGYQAGVTLVSNTRSRDQRPKIMKPCLYFNTSRGCRNGANCAYQHDASFQPRSGGVSEVQNAKRMKMDREISS